MQIYHDKTISFGGLSMAILLVWCEISLQIDFHPVVGGVFEHWAIKHWYIKHWYKNKEQI